MVSYVRKSPGNNLEVTYLADWLASIGGQYHYCHRWIPRVPAKNVQHVYVAIHGLGDHGGRFDTFARAMAASGIAVQAIDLTGHGRSPGKRGRIDSYNTLLAEIQWSVREASQVWRNASITLLGHSMGGNLVLSYLEQLAASVQGSAPEYVRPINRSPDRVIAVAPMLRPYGTQIREDFLRVGCHLAKWVPNWPMRMSHRPNMLSTDPATSNSYTSDPLVHHTMSIRLGIELFLAGRRLMQSNQHTKIPCLLVHGSEDRLSDISGSKEYCQDRNNAALWELEGELHDPLNGLRREWLYAKIADWSGHKRELNLRDLNIQAA